MTARGRRVAASAVSALLALAGAHPAPSRAAEPKPGPTVTIRRAAGPITLDGDLSDAGWRGADSLKTWYETNPGDNIEPAAHNLAFLTYDDKYFYAAFQFDDPHPELIRAPLGDHDGISSANDYGGLILDSRNEGKTAQMFLATPCGVEYDAVSSDVSGEDNSPDYYWDAVGKVTSTGWNLEIRVPLSSLRYSDADHPTWRVLLYRNYPRDRRYQYFSTRLPRNVSCFICNSSLLVGLDHLPHGSHLVLAPFATAQKSDTPRDGLGTPLTDRPFKADGGLDAKWSPGATVAFDGTFNPDFSQVESDAAQITANERFALFYPEKRTFFLEGIDLFATPFQAVYTRTINSPSDGLRTTGRVGATAFTALAAHDRGGGLVIMPGPQGSHFAAQDFRSDVGVVRLRHDLGLSFVSLLATGRNTEDGGNNYVVGPDFQWRARPTDTFTGQALWSGSKTPNRTDLDPEWNGQRLDDHALLANWGHSTGRIDGFFQGQDLGKDFRADDGFIPQVGYREGYFDGGYTIHPTKQFLSRVRFFSTDYLDTDHGGTVLNQRVSVGAGMDGRFSSFLRVELNEDATRVGNDLLRRFRPRVNITANPGMIVNSLAIDSYFGQEIDFDNGREGTGATLLGTAVLRPDRHLELRYDGSYRWLDEDDGAGRSGRLFRTQVQRVRGTWCFNARSFVRLIGQYIDTKSDTSLYTFTVPVKDAHFTTSGLFAYKLNWQTVLYLGYGDDEKYLDVTNRLRKNARQAFAKLSYAYQM